MIRVFLLTFVSFEASAPVNLPHEQDARGEHQRQDNHDVGRERAARHATACLLGSQVGNRWQTHIASHTAYRGAIDGTGQVQPAPRPANQLAVDGVLSGATWYSSHCVPPLARLREGQAL